MIEDFSNFVVPAAIAAAALTALVLIAVITVRAARQRDREAAERQMAEVARLQAETSIRIEAMRDMLAGRQAEMTRSVSEGQAELARAVNERLDSVTHHLSQSMTSARQHTVESLQKLNERLVVIDSAQKNITDLASQVTSLQSVLSNKQARGAFGQGRMEIIVQDGLPKGCFEFQYTLPNKSRPDCVVFLPDGRPLAIDAKFPLESVTAFREAETRRCAQARRHPAAPGCRAARQRHRAEIPDPGRDAGFRADVRAIGVGICRIARRVR